MGGGNENSVMEYITRLTPNDNEWIKPSCKKGKCCFNKNTLYECQHGFGWEEWLLKDYWADKKECKGFVQALNGNTNKKTIKRLHLYTRKCISQNNKVNMYVGYIDNVKIIPINNRALSQSEITKRAGELKQCGLVIPNDGMVKKAYNILFNSIDVHLCFNKGGMRYTLNLAQGQYRFGLYDINFKHTNIGKQIKRFKCVNQ